MTTGRINQIATVKTQPAPDAPQSRGYNQHRPGRPSRSQARPFGMQFLCTDAETQRTPQKEHPATRRSVAKLGTPAAQHLASTPLCRPTWHTHQTEEHPSIASPSGRHALNQSVPLRRAPRGFPNRGRSAPFLAAPLHKGRSTAQAAWCEWKQTQKAAQRVATQRPPTTSRTRLTARQECSFDRPNKH
jgi:hypothetical protein